MFLKWEAMKIIKGSVTDPNPWKLGDFFAGYDIWEAMKIRRGMWPTLGNA